MTSVVIFRSDLNRKSEYEYEVKIKEKKMSENTVKRGNPNLKGREPGPGAIHKDTDKKKFADVWNGVEPVEGKKTSDLLLQAMVDAGIANDQTDISQIRAFASQVRDAGYDCKSFRQASVVIDQKVAIICWRKITKVDGSANQVAEMYCEKTGATNVEEVKSKIVKLAQELRALGLPIAKLAGENDTASRNFDRQKFVDIWQSAKTLGEAIDGLKKAGILSSKMDQKACEKKALRLAKEIRGIKRDGKSVGVKKMVSKRDKNGDVIKDANDKPVMEKITVAPFCPELKKFKANTDAKKAQFLALFDEIDQEIGEEFDDEDGVDEEDEENADEDDGENSEEVEESSEVEIDPFG